MDDKQLMEDLLLLEKGVCDLYMHGAVEAGTPNVKGAFRSALQDSLCMQGTTYDRMTAKGWYKNDPADGNKVSELKRKFSAQG